MSTFPRRAYAGVTDTLAAELGAGRELADATDNEIAAACGSLERWPDVGARGDRYRRLIRPESPHLSARRAAVPPDH